MLAYDSTLRVPLILALPPKGGSHEIAANSPGSRLQTEGRVDSARVARGSRGHAPSRRGARRSGGHAARGRSAVAAKPTGRRSIRGPAGWHDLTALAFDQWKLVRLVGGRALRRRGRSGGDAQSRVPEAGARRRRAQADRGAAVREDAAGRVRHCAGSRGTPARAGLCLGRRRATGRCCARIPRNRSPRGTRSSAS